MSGIATAIAVSAVVGAVAAKKASKTQGAAADTANSEIAREYDQTRTDYAPFREAGVSVLPQLTEGLKPGGDFNRDFTIADFYANQDPGYQFRMDEGAKATERGAAARGGLYSGAEGKALQRYGQDYASGEYSNAYSRFNNDRTTRFNRLSALAGTAQTATKDLAQLGAQSTGQIAENTLQKGNSQASGYVGASNAVTGGAQTLGDFYLQQQYLKRIPMPVTGGRGASPYVGYQG